MEEIQISFSPSNVQIQEIKQWLISEDKRTGDGFYSNWHIIEPRVKKQLVVTISERNKTLGFATWFQMNSYVAKLDIVEIKPGFRKKGLGKKLLSRLLDYLKDMGIVVVYLECFPASSERVWRKLGFTEFPAKMYTVHSQEHKHLYKILIETADTIENWDGSDVIKMWDQDYSFTKTSTPTWIWKLDFINGCRQLNKPIIFPAEDLWRIEWASKDTIIFSDGINYFKKNIHFDKFLIIQTLD